MSVATHAPRQLRTQSMRYNSITVVLVMGLVLREHGTADAVRRAAMDMSRKVAMEQQPRMKKLARLMDDETVMRVALRIAQDGTDGMGIYPGEPFPVKQQKAPVEPPRCHMKPMKLSGYHRHRHWKCQHCAHTKPLRPEDLPE